MNKDLSMEKYVENIEQKLNIEKKISLYKLLKENCSDSIKIIQKKFYGSKKIPKNDNKWYVEFLNYLSKQEVLVQNITNHGIYHSVTPDYVKYFINSESTKFDEDNFKEHLMLYKEASIDFLIKTKILKEKKNIKKESIPEKIKNYFESNKKYQNILGSFIMLCTAVNVARIIGMFGIYNCSSIFLMSILFTIGILIFTI